MLLLDWGPFFLDPQDLCSCSEHRHQSQCGFEKYIFRRVHQFQHKSLLKFDVLKLETFSQGPEQEEGSTNYTKRSDTTMVAKRQGVH